MPSATAAAAAAASAEVSPVASRKGLRLDKAKVKSENNRSLRKMKKNRSIVRQMLFPNSNSSSAAAAAAAAAPSSAPTAAAKARGKELAISAKDNNQGRTEAVWNLGFGLVHASTISS